MSAPINAPCRFSLLLSSLPSGQRYMSSRVSLGVAMVNSFVTRVVCGCCGFEFETGNWKEDYECPAGNHYCHNCSDYYRSYRFPCKTGGQCKADEVRVNMYGSCRHCR